MDSIAIDARYSFARALIAEAAALALDYHRELDTLIVETKGPQDLVSEADRSVEALIRERITHRFPHDGFVGEESGLVPGESGTWVVDPIDGTQDFLLGFPTWCVSIAFVVGDETVFGLVTAPATDDHYEARVDGGAQRNGVPLRASAAASLAEGVTAIGYSSRTRPEQMASMLERLARQGGVMRSIGSGALMIVYVATGQCLGYVEHFINGWDCLAALCIVKEAGGRTNNFLAENGPAGSGPVIAAGPVLYDTVASLLDEGRPSLE